MHVETAIISSCACFVHFLYGQSALGIFGVFIITHSERTCSQALQVSCVTFAKITDLKIIVRVEIFFAAQIVMTEYGYALITLYWLNT